jgi:hypothetical protein
MSQRQRVLCRHVFERLDEKNRGFVTISQLYDIIPVEAVDFVTPSDVQSMCKEVGLLAVALLCYLS